MVSIVILAIFVWVPCALYCVLCAHTGKSHMLFARRCPAVHSWRGSCLVAVTGAGPGRRGRSSWAELTWTAHIYLTEWSQHVRMKREEERSSAGHPTDIPGTERCSSQHGAEQRCSPGAGTGQCPQSSSCPAPYCRWCGNLGSSCCSTAFHFNLPLFRESLLAVSAAFTFLQECICTILAVSELL